MGAIGRQSAVKGGVVTWGEVKHSLGLTYTRLPVEFATAMAELLDEGAVEVAKTPSGYAGYRLAAGVEAPDAWPSQWRPGDPWGAATAEEAVLGAVQRLEARGEVPTLTALHRVQRRLDRHDAGRVREVLDRLVAKGALHAEQVRTGRRGRPSVIYSTPQHEEAQAA